MDASTLEFTHSDASGDIPGITAGEEYNFKVQATNSVGDSLLSPATAIKAATVPD